MSPIRSIIVPLDGSPFARQALEYAVALGRLAKARLHVVLVHDPVPAPRTPEAKRLYTSVELATRRAARDYLSNIVRGLKREGYLNATSVVLTGRPETTLVEHIGEREPSLVVMTTHGRGPLSRAWLGSVADYLVRHVSVPVLLLRPSEDRSPPVEPSGQILIPVDGSELAEAAMEHGAELARLTGAEVRLVRVVRPVPVMSGIPMAVPSGYDERLTEMCRQEAEDYIQHLVERLREEGLSATGVTICSEMVAGTILELADDPRVGLIALGTRGRAGVRRLIFGSVADKLIRSANRPVLVCPSRRRRR